MASRRLRLKGIANIPARKKSDNDLPIINESIIIETKAIEKPNHSSEEKTSDSISIGQESKSHDDSNEAVPSIRRKFIKPTVAVQSINRNKMIVKNNTEVTINQKSINEKIVILNETIIEANSVKSEGEQEKTDPTTVSGELLQKKVIKKVVPAIINNPDNEYPAPPPSPSKVNRSRIRAIPRLHQRKTSFSASESEDETRKNNYNNRHRNDSVCSTTSTTQSEYISPQKPKEFNSVIQRKCRRTEQSRKLAEARRDFYLKFGNNKPDRQKLTMMDLIFYNPTTNLMSHETKSKNKEQSTGGGEEEEGGGQSAVEEEAVDDPITAAAATKDKSDEENEIPAPQIKIGPLGEIVIDEQSLVIENKEIKKSREVIAKSKIIDGDFDTNYGIYKRAKRTKDWPKYETLRFYKALNIIGTDFTLMCDLFPNRSRRELKLKFKKEERVNKVLVDRAVTEPCIFKFNEFKLEVDMEERELAELERQKKNEVSKKKQRVIGSKTENKTKSLKLPTKRKKAKMDIMDCLDDESDADESEIESDPDDIVDEMDCDDSSNEVIKTIQKPTRSGRVPRILKKYQSSPSLPPPPVPPTPSPPPIVNNPNPTEICDLSNIEAGSLMIVADSASDNESVYKVYMFSPDKSEKDVKFNSDNNNLFHDRKSEIRAQNILTITESKIKQIKDDEEEVKENNITIPAENNMTIPAEEIITISVQDDQSVVNKIEL